MKISKNYLKLTIAYWAKIRPIRSLWFRLLSWEISRDSVSKKVSDWKGRKTATQKKNKNNL
jgi:hypothetical protein